MKPPPFALTRAESPDQATALLHELGDEAKVLAGGQSLLPMMGLRMATPSHLVDVNRCVSLDYIRAGAGELAIGALTRHVVVERAGLDGPWAALAEAAPVIAHYPIRTRGTFGGSLSHADATAEWPLVALTLGARIVAQSSAGLRQIPAEQFFEGVFTTNLRPEELVVEARFPQPPAGAVSAFEEFSERAGDFALASVCVALACDDGGRCTWARVGLGAVAPVPVRSAAAEAVLVSAPMSPELVREAGAAAAADCAPRDGLHVSAAFRRELVATLVERALSRVASSFEGVPKRLDASSEAG